MGISDDYSVEVIVRYHGIKEGIRRYAHWKDGIQYVGTGCKTLEDALKEVDEEERQTLARISPRSES